MAHYIIDRSKWVCGIRYDKYKTLGHSMLLNERGRQCCLGQIMEQEGIPRTVLSSLLFPVDVQNIFKDLTVPSWLTQKKSKEYVINSTLAIQMMNVNDSLDFTQKQREQRLMELAAEAGHTLEFVGELFPEKEDAE